MDFRNAIGSVVLLCGGCAHSGVLPPFPAEWPVDGVEIPHPAEAAGSNLVPGLGPPCDAATGVAPCETPGFLPPADAAGPTTAPLLSNPIFLPVIDHDAAWESIVDVVDDYFRIAREERVRVVDNILTEGRIETYPQVGATLLEPHRPDSVGPYNRLLATFQTIRRIAVVRVAPVEGGYQVEVLVETQMEDLPHPENATAGSATLRADTSIPEEDTIRRLDRLSGVWYPTGRDVALEQQILAEIRGCLDVAPPGVVY